MKKCCCNCGHYRNGIGCTNDKSLNPIITSENDHYNIYELFLMKHLNPIKKTEIIDNIMIKTEELADPEKIVETLIGQMCISQRLRQKMQNLLYVIISSIKTKVMEIMAESTIEQISNKLFKMTYAQSEPNIKIIINNPETFYCSDYWG